MENANIMLESNNNNSFYQQITFLMQKDIAELELFIDACSEMGALAVSVEDAMANTKEETPIYGEPNCETSVLWTKSKVMVLLDEDTVIEEFVQNLQQFTQEEIPNYSVENIQNTDWVTLTQSQFDPIPIGEKIIIVPSWHLENIIQKENKKIINLDPGLAFGTGSHATTNLCLQWLEQNIQEDKNIHMLDYGCGSGILAICAAKLGNWYRYRPSSRTSS
jgi:ribosomal protein L11 methyltransferase